MLEGPEFRHYVSFLVVAEECNFRKAAERLRIAQPSLSAQIKQLEARIPAVLFRRTPAGVSLTRAGHLLIPHAKEMLRLRERSTRDTSAMHTGLELPLRFGFSPLVRQELIENALRGYREVVPGGMVESSGNGPETLAGLVVQGRLDAALTTLPIPQEGLRMKTVCSEAMRVCLRRDDPLANEQTVTKDEVQRRLTVFFSRDAHPLFHDDLLSRFRHFGIELRPSSFVLSPSQMQSVVKASGELGLLPETTPHRCGTYASTRRRRECSHEDGLHLESRTAEPVLSAIDLPVDRVMPAGCFSLGSQEESPCFGGVGRNRAKRKGRLA